MESSPGMPAQPKPTQVGLNGLRLNSRGINPPATIARAGKISRTGRCARIVETAMYTYYLTTKFKILYAMISLLIFALLFMIFSPNYVCLGVYGAFILIVAFKNIASEKIEISDKGIEYHRLGLTFNTKWENVRELETQWFPPFEQEGILLDPDQIRITEWWSGNYTGYGGWSRRSFIPLSKFSEHWRDSELGQQIKKYAPHLFEKEKSG